MTGVRGQTIAVAAIVLLSLYPALFRWPMIPVWRMGDQSIFLLHAVGMLRGRVLYRDLFQFNLPGTEALYYVMFKCFGVQLWVAPLAELAADTATVVLILALSRRVLSGVAALLPALIFFFAFLDIHLQATHHVYSVPLVLLGVWVVAGGTNWRRLSLAGVILGLATLFTSDRGVFAAAGVAVFLIWKLGARRECVRALEALFLPFVAVVGGTLLYLVHTAGARVVFDSVLVFPLRYYGTDQSSNGMIAFWSEFLGGLSAGGYSIKGITNVLIAVVTLLLCVGTPVILAFFLARPLRKQNAGLRASVAGQTQVLYAIVGCFLVLAEVHSLSSLRLSAAIPFAFVIAVEWLNRRAGVEALRYSLIGCVVLGMILPIYRLSHSLERLQAPSGDVYLTQESYSMLAPLARLIPSGNCYVADPDISFVLALDDPTRLQMLTVYEYTRPQQVEEFITTLEKRPDCLVRWDRSFDRQRGPGDHLAALRRYLQADYRIVYVDEYGNETLERIGEGTGSIENGGRDGHS
jgi:hypothetical protein